MKRLALTLIAASLLSPGLSLAHARAQGTDIRLRSDRSQVAGSGEEGDLPLDERGNDGQRFIAGGVHSPDQRRVSALRHLRRGRAATYPVGVGTLESHRSRCGGQGHAIWSGARPALQTLPHFERIRTGGTRQGSSGGSRSAHGYKRKRAYRHYASCRVQAVLASSGSALRRTSCHCPLTSTTRPKSPPLVVSPARLLPTEAQPPDGLVSIGLGQQ